jgi:hypothetical protein
MPLTDEHKRRAAEALDPPGEPSESEDDEPPSQP